MKFKKLKSAVRSIPAEEKDLGNRLSVLLAKS
jgi:hypothetical protein